VLSVAASCGSDSGTAPAQVNAAGTWNLTTFNGAPLPATIQRSSPKIELLSDKLVLLPDGTFTDTYSIRNTSFTGDVTLASGSDSGRYSVSAFTIHLVYADGSISSGSVTSTTLTLILGTETQITQTQVYQRQ
jgi:hypothetical protein